MAEVNIAADKYRASIRTLGAGLNSLTFQGRDLVDPYISANPPMNYRGDVLAPWPNRIEDGLYEVDGIEYKVPINEPDRRTALHGLVNTLEWKVVEANPTSVLLEVHLKANISYPTELHLSAQYSLSDAGLAISISATNVGVKSAPYGVSIHPYLIPTSNSKVDEWTLSMNASHVLDVDLKRLLPIALRPVEELDFDFRAGKLVGTRFIDHAFKVDEGSDLIVTVSAPNGEEVAMTFTPDCEWIQIHTADRSGGEDSRICLAVEPMTCAPNAFRNSLGVAYLSQGETTSTTWKIQGK